MTTQAKGHTYIIIGISDAPQPTLSADAREAIRQAKVFSGGARHREIVGAMLPPGALWIDIKAPLDGVFSQYSALTGQTIVVFASGDPLFFGFANTIRSRQPGATVRLMPTFNSLQTLAHRILMPYHDMRIVSLTGRPWLEFDRALIECEPKIGVLTDHRNTPGAIAERMLAYGFAEYTMTVGEHLGNPQRERITTTTLANAARQRFDSPNCAILQATEAFRPRRLFGIPDERFTPLNGRQRMITKMPIRLLTLQALELRRAKVMWDVGFCTGSVSIEALMQFPGLSVWAFERRPECESLIGENARKLGTPGINVRMGDFLTASLDEAQRPDAAFIGGHGGQLGSIFQRIFLHLAPGGRIVMNSVAPESRSAFIAAAEQCGIEAEQVALVALDDYNPITIMKATKK